MRHPDEIFKLGFKPKSTKQNNEDYYDLTNFVPQEMNINHLVLRESWLGCNSLHHFISWTLV